jgi:DNA-binding response OmpR family regulator
MKILVGDSDPKTLEAVSTCCADRWPHRELLVAEDFVQLTQMIEQDEPDLVVMDSELSNELGLNLCREIRNFSAVPLIMIAATGSEIETIQALDAGADDCISKPVRPLELQARIVAVLRRAQMLPLVSRGHPFVSGKIFIDFDIYEVRIDGNEVRLTVTEFEILRCLVNNPRRVISHSQLSRLVWGDTGHSSRNALKVHIQNLRNKLGDTAGKPHYILSERGLGYKFSTS